MGTQKKYKITNIPFCTAKNPNHLPRLAHPPVPNHHTHPLYTVQKALISGILKGRASVPKSPILSWSHNSHSWYTKYERWIAKILSQIWELTPESFPNCERYIVYHSWALTPAVGIPNMSVNII